LPWSIWAMIEKLRMAGTTDPALKTNKGDPNRMVCRTEIEGATRLDRRRACHTVAEWADLRRQTRANIDHIQTTRPGSY
jgi:poly(3-hydroxybutyrate) depolymerase